MKDKKIVERMIPTKGGEWLRQQHLAMYKLVIPFVKDKKILDAGCGYGLGSWVWLKSGAQYIEAYDISEEALDFAKQNYQSEKMKFGRLDFNKDSFPQLDFFDLVCSIEVIEHLKNYQFYLNNISNSLKKGGILFLTTPRARFSSKKSRFHIHEFTAHELEKLLLSFNFKVFKKYSFATNSLSKFSSKYFPNFLVSLIKKVPLYSLLVKGLCNPKVSGDIDSGETLTFIAKRR